MRSALLLTPILLGLVAGGAARWVDSPAPAGVSTDRAAASPPAAASVPAASAKERPAAKKRATKQTGRYETVLADLPDIDALVALQPPSADAPTHEWVAFGRSLPEVDSGQRYGNHGITTPILVWYALIARNRPEAIYQLHAEKVVGDSQLGHLIQFGLLPDWYEHLENADALILTDGAALTSLAVAEGIDFARRRFADAFLAAEGRRRRLSMENLRFSLASMNEAEIAAVLPKLQSGTFDVDARGLRRLMLGGRFDDAREAVLALMVDNGSSSRSMSSYFVHGAELGHADYVDGLIGDAADNARQPTNFYCAACGLALVTDGLLGTPLIEAVAGGRRVRLERVATGFVVSLADRVE